MSDLCTVKKSTLDGIAEAIQSKTGESGGMLPSEMAGKIEDRAEVNVINSVERADGTALTPVNKKITLPAQVVISDTEPTDTSVLWIDTSDDTVDGIDNGEEISFPEEVGE